MICTSKRHQGWKGFVVLSPKDPVHILGNPFTQKQFQRPLYPWEDQNLTSSYPNWVIVAHTNIVMLDITQTANTPTKRKQGNLLSGFLFQKLANIKCKQWFHFSYPSQFIQPACFLSIEDKDLAEDLENVVFFPQYSFFSSPFCSKIQLFPLLNYTRPGNGPSFFHLLTSVHKPGTA